MSFYKGNKVPRMSKASTFLTHTDRGVTCHFLMHATYDDYLDKCIQ